MSIENKFKLDFNKLKENENKLLLVIEFLDKKHKFDVEKDANIALKIKNNSEQNSFKLKAKIGIDFKIYDHEFFNEEIQINKGESKILHIPINGIFKFHVLSDILVIYLYDENNTYIITTMMEVN